jgi:hypothetical protein
MKKMLFFLLMAMVSCGQNENKDTTGADSTIVITNDTIPEVRPSVKTAAVASYSEKVKDELNDWKFAVSAFETKRTFHFILRMQYKELRVSDSLHIPNFGIQPVIEIKKGPEPLSCIIGFLDKKGQFKDYKKVAIKNEQLKFTTLNSYYVGSYRTPKKS